MSKSEFRNRGLKVVVDTTQRAEYDFALHGITARQQGRIARNLKAFPNSPRDICVGEIRIREVIEGWDVAFIIALDKNEVVVLIIGLERTGELESHFQHIVRSGVAALPPAAQVLLKGRKKKR